jgi:hypothetical protein
MARAHGLELLMDALKHQSGHQASPARLSGLLGWDLAKVKRVADRGNSDSAVPIYTAKGGVIKHRGSERGAPVVDSKDWNRILWTATELGVGVVTFARAHAYGTWAHEAAASLRTPSPDERDAFLTLTMSAANRA